MIDAHSHILYGVDDGIELYEDMLVCIKHMSSFGFREIIPTPHRFHMFFNPEVADVVSRIYEIESSMVTRFSFEYMFSKESIETEEKLYELYRSPSGWRVVLVEFMPFMSGKNDIEKAVFLLNSMGISPLLAHIERYGLPDSFWIELKNKYSVFYQVVLKNMARKFFESRKKQIVRLLDAGLVDNVASDLHKVQELSLVEKGLDFFNRRYSHLSEKLFTLSFE